MSVKMLTIMGMLLLAITVIVFVILYQKRLFIQQARMHEMETAHQKDLLDSSIKAQEVEREQVAMNLHDGVGSLLSAVKLFVAQLDPEKSRGDYEELLQETKALINHAITQTREISHDLLPGSLETFGVIHAIEEHCLRLHKLNSMKVAFNCEEFFRMEKQQELALYRILQELSNNTIKHADASKIQVDLEAKGNDVIFSYKDNGKGFDQVSYAKFKDALGLKSIESRVNLLNASMEIVTSSGQGFNMILQWRIAEKPIIVGAASL